MNPVYIKLKDKKWQRCLDVNDLGIVYIDIAEDDDIIGIEILSKDYKIEIDGKTHEQN